MTPQELIDAFETLADAPDGVKQLRELVLQLAVRGKLVPQDSQDEPASVLLERIAAEKARLVKEGKIRKPKPLPPIEGDEVPFEVPVGWEWRRVGEVGHIFSGNSIPGAMKSAIYSKVEGGLPYIATKDVGYGRDELAYDNGVRIPLDEPKFKVALAGTTLVCAEGGSAGRKVGFVRTDVCFGNKLVAIQPLADLVPRFLFFYCQAPSFRGAFRERMTGIIGGISKSKFQTIELPLPPQAEQRRIVAKVDELMELLDSLEAARDARDGTRAALRDSALAALRDADDSEAVESAWSLISENMEELFSTPEDVVPLRQTILQLAVRGRLVAQDPKDEPASVLLERIATEKARLVEEGKIRKPKPLPPIEADEVPFEVPGGWGWVRADALFEFVTSGSRGWARYYSEAGPLFLRIGNLDYQTTRLDLDHVQRVTPPSSAEGRRTGVKTGDLLVSITGDVGMVGLIPDGLGEAFINQHIALARPIRGIHPDFLALQMTAPSVSFQLMDSRRGIKNSLGLDDVRHLRVSLPPLAEQHRIVAKVDELMSRCDNLEARLTATRDVRAAFAAGAVHHLDTA